MHAERNNMAANHVGVFPEMTADIPGQTTVDNGISQAFNKKGLKRKISDTVTSVSMCDVCQISLNSSSQAAQHFQGKSHLTKIRSSQRENSTVSTSSVIGPVVPTSAPTCPVLSPSSLSQHLDPTVRESTDLPMSNGLYNLYCKVCGKSFNSQSQAQQHYTSKQHQLKVQEKAEMTPVEVLPSATVVPFVAKLTSSGETQAAGGGVTSMSDVKLGGNIKSKLFRCEACDITLNSEAQFEQHNRGLRHKMSTGQVAGLPTPEDQGWQGVRYRKLAKVMKTVDTPTGAVMVPSSTPGGTRLGQFYCEMCDISVNSQIQLKQHLSGEKHKMCVEGRLPVQSHGRGRGRGRGQMSILGRSRGGIQGTPRAFPGHATPAVYQYPRPPPLYRSFVSGGDSLPDEFSSELGLYCGHTQGMNS